MKPRAAIMLFVFLMSFAAILRGPTIVRGEPAVASRKQYKYDARKVEASIELGERVASFIRSTYGPERADRMLEDVARRATRGSQPSRSGSQPSRPIDPVIIDLVEEDLADSPLGDDPTTVLPYGFWRRFMTEDMEIEFSRKKKDAAESVVDVLCTPQARRRRDHFCHARFARSRILSQQWRVVKCSEGGGIGLSIVAVLRGLSPATAV